jgi:hypothetical protein
MTTINNATVRLVNTSNLKTVTLRTSVSRLDQLDDVIEGTPGDGDVLVYRAADDKYVVQPIDASSLLIDIDGGSF